MSVKVLETTNLTKDYGKGRGIFDISFSVNQGEVFGFIGTNGSGKTTTIRNMMGFIKPDEGSATINGINSWTDSATIMQNVSYVPGEIAFPALSTGTEFLKSQAKYLGVKDFTYMNHVIELLQLDPTADLKRMSKGMKQKTAITAALMGEKDILVLDEPTTGLDPLMRDAFLELIQEEKKKGHTVFMSSHIFEEIEEVCDRVAMIKNGHIIDTLSLDNLRCPKEKHFIIEFNSEMQLQKFHSIWNGQIKQNVPKVCEVIIPVSDMDLLMNIVKEFQVINFTEKHKSLQEHFMEMYKKEGKTYEL